MAIGLYEIQPVEMDAATTVVAANRLPLDWPYHAPAEPGFCEAAVSTESYTTPISVRQSCSMETKLTVCRVSLAKTHSS